MVYPWGTSRRFNAWSNYIKGRFGHRVQKVAIDAGFSCPNRDGTLGTGGCTYCDNNAFSPSYCTSSQSISSQVEKGMAFHRKRYKSATRFIAYFQSYSNTYAPLEVLKERYAQALAFKDVAGLAVGTRPDTLEPETLDYLARLSEKYFITLELGIESCYDKTLNRINRGHTFDTTRKALEEAASRGLDTAGHMIFGLPGESKTEMLNQAEILSQLPLNSLKMHQLQLIQGTRMLEDYKKNPKDFLRFSYEDYKTFVVEFLERLSPDIRIERMAGEAPPDYVFGERWNLRNDQILAGIEQKLQQENTWQSKKYKKFVFLDRMNW